MACQTGGGPIAPFTLFTQFEHEPPRPVLNSLKQELTNILSAVGMPPEWRTLGASPGPPSSSLAVANFKGRCNIDGLLNERQEIGMLGWTHITDGQVLPFCGVDCDRVRAFLARPLLQVQAREREQAYGQALARVLAHELYHIVTETRHHSPSGVAEAAFTEKDLLREQFSFSLADRRILESRLEANSSGHPKTRLKGESLYAGSGCAQCHGNSGQGAQAPPLRAAGRPVRVKDLAARLGNRASEMYRRAHQLGALWPTLAKPDLETLCTYLNADD